MKIRTCCFVGHRKIDETKELKLKLKEIIEKMITENLVDTFLFGSKSRFNDLCYEIVTEIKGKSPYVKGCMSGRSIRISVMITSNIFCKKI